MDLLNYKDTFIFQGLFFSNDDNNVNTQILNADQKVSNIIDIYYQISSKLSPCKSCKIVNTRYKTIGPSISRKDMQKRF